MPLPCSNPSLWLKAKACKVLHHLAPATSKASFPSTCPSHALFQTSASGPLHLWPLCLWCFPPDTLKISLPSGLCSHILASDGLLWIVIWNNFPLSEAPYPLPCANILSFTCCHPLYYISSSLGDKKLSKGRAFDNFISVSSVLEYFPVHRRHSINICEMKEWITVK